jgi:hypothetical protein
MKKSIFLITLGLFAGLVSLSSCGGGEDEAAKKKADSLAAVHVADSLRAIVVADSMAHVAEMDSMMAAKTADSLAALGAGYKAGTNSKPKPVINMIDKGKTTTVVATPNVKPTTTGGKIDVTNKPAPGTTGGKIKVK